MKMKYRKKLKYIFFMLWMTILVSIFFPISVKAMEEEEKEQLGLVDNPYYSYYQGLSEEEKEKFEVIPRPYLLQKPLLIDKDGVHTQENKIALYRARQVLPTKYTLEQDIKIAAKNQKSLEICWAFTAFRCLETHLALNGAGYYDFSELHLDYLTSDLYGGKRELHSGGNFYDFVNYVQDGAGPIMEEDLPLQSDVTAENLQESDEMIAHIQEMIQENGLEKGSVTPRVTNIVARAFESFDITKATEAEKTAFQNDIKTYIQNNGAIEAYIFFEDFLECYSEENAAFLSPAIEMPEYGHGVNVIGWDDDFPKENFTGKYQPSQDGAWIVTNSWGEDWGEEGYFYISYEDYFFYQYLTGIEEAKVVVTNPLDISIVSLSSSWNEDWNKRPQEIVITPILMQDDSSVQTIKVNGESQEIRNGKAYYTIVKPGTYEIEVIDNHGNSREKTYVVNKMDIQKPEVEISSNSMDSSMREVIFTVNAKDEGESGLADYLFIHRSIDEEGTWFQVAGDTRYENTGELFWSEGFEKDSSGKQITASTRYVFPEEGSYTFYVKAVDMAGNESEVKSITVFFDQTPPVVQVEYDEKNTGIVTIVSNEKLQPLDGWILEENGLQLIKRYLQSTQEEIMVKDESGNSVVVPIQVTVENQVVVGDINQDNLINTADVLILLRYIASVKSESVKQKHPDWILQGDSLVFADINQDTNIDVSDVLGIQRHIAAIRSEVVKQKHPDWILTNN